MIRINLLPYREYRRKAKLYRDGIGALVFLVLLLSVVGLGYWHLKSVEQHHRARVQYMEQALSDIQDKLGEVNDLKDKRKLLIQKLKVIQDLQTGRDLPVRILQTLAEAVPKEISLRSVEQKGDGLALEGVARSNNVVSSFMRRLEAADLFANPDLQVISGGRQRDGARKEFSMRVSILPAGKRGGEG